MGNIELIVSVMKRRSKKWEKEIIYEDVNKNKKGLFFCKLTKIERIFQKQFLEDAGNSNNTNIN